MRTKGTFIHVRCLRPGDHKIHIPQMQIEPARNVFTFPLRITVSPRRMDSWVELTWTFRAGGGNLNHSATRQSIKCYVPLTVNPILDLPSGFYAEGSWNTWPLLFQRPQLFCSRDRVGKNPPSSSVWKRLPKYVRLTCIYTAHVIRSHFALFSSGIGFIQCLSSYMPYCSYTQVFYCSYLFEAPPRNTNAAMLILVDSVMHAGANIRVINFEYSVIHGWVFWPSYMWSDSDQPSQWKCAHPNSGISSRSDHKSYECRAWSSISIKPFRVEAPVRPSFVSCTRTRRPDRACRIPDSTIDHR